jgi:uncharacterized protein
MTKRSVTRLINVLLIGLAVSLTAIPCHAAPTQKLAFSGGPNGGTFQYFSNGIATRLTRMEDGFEVINLPSAGSVENIRRINSDDADFGIAYAGDIFLARKGLLANDQQTYQNVLALAYLYGAPVQLVVLDDNPIKSVYDLVGKKVTVGGAGSGSAATAERYFKSLGIWDQLNVEFIGYSKAAAALSEHRIDAMWILAGFPTAAVQQAAAKNQVRLIDVWTPAQESGFFNKFPFYSEVTIPGKTYINVNKPMKSFQDSAIWIAGKQLSAETVQAALENIFSPEGLDYMVKVKKTAREMSVKAALTGIVTPVHPGAKTFWKSKGLGFFPTD